jgi:hypothetical protein
MLPNLTLSVFRDDLVMKTGWEVRTNLALTSHHASSFYDQIGKTRPVRGRAADDDTV